MAIENQDLIEQYKILHKENPDYGKSSMEYLPYIQHVVDTLQLSSAIDYGCGKSELIDSVSGLQVKCRYDPAIKEYCSQSVLFSHYDLLICTDVFEHIPKKDVQKFIDSISVRADRLIVAICHREAYNNLPNGENAHATVEPREWWMARLVPRPFKYFKLLYKTENTNLFLFEK